MVVKAASFICLRPVVYPYTLNSPEVYWQLMIPDDDSRAGTCNIVVIRTGSVLCTPTTCKLNQPLCGCQLTLVSSQSPQITDSISSWPRLSDDDWKHGSHDRLDLTSPATTSSWSHLNFLLYPYPVHVSRTNLWLFLHLHRPAGISCSTPSHGHVCRSSVTPVLPLVSQLLEPNWTFVETTMGHK